MNEENVDFSYRNLSEPEELSAHAQEPRNGHGLQAAHDDLVSVVTHDVHVQVPGHGPAHGGDAGASASTSTPRRGSLLLPALAAAALTPQGDREPNDWASEEGTRQGLGPMSRRTTMADLLIGRRESAARHRVDMPQLVSSNTSAPSPMTKSHALTPLSMSAPASPTVNRLKAAQQQGSKETLHGKDLTHFVSIGSIDQIARHSNSVDWSESMAMPEEPDHLTLMDPYYDLTKTKLSRVFSLFHPDASGMVSYEGFRRGLEAMGIICADDEEFQTFIEKVDEDRSGGISYEEFQQAIQEIKLGQLFKEEFIREMALDSVHHKRTSALLGSIEYSPDRIRSVYPIGNIEKFIYSRKPSWAKVRWINVEGYDPLMIRRLSVRYRLHPLAVEDALDVDRERPKYEKYDEHSSLVLQSIHPKDINVLRTYQRMYRNSLYSRDDGPSQFELMGKKELEERLEELRIGKIMTNPEQLSIYVLKDVVISVQERQSSLWGVLKARLDTSYSKIRQHGTSFLVYTMVDACVDDLTPIVHTMGAKLEMLERLFNLDPNRFDVLRVQHCSKQLKGLKRLCKPLNEVIVQMSESNDFNGEILRYFRDVQDHIAIIEEDCDKHLDACKSLVDQFNNNRGAQQSDVSYLLSLVAAIFLPAQFLTGLYGMNFEFMPELKHEYGYYIWWAVVLAIAFATVVFFHFYKRWL